jgi:hypothetical protein
MHWLDRATSPDHFPASHWMHPVMAWAGWYFPWMHFVQALSTSGLVRGVSEYLPGLHARHSATFRALAIFPMMHAMHVV